MKEFIEKLIGRLEEYKYTHLIEHNCEICKHCDEQGKDCVNLDCMLCVWDKAKVIVNELAEEYNNGWIPCSERLPKEKGFYIVTQEIYSFDGKRLLRTVTKADTLFNPVNQKWNISDNLKVIAWQPLPQPYKIEDKPQESKQEWKDSVMSHFTKVE